MSKQAGAESLRQSMGPYRVVSWQTADALASLEPASTPRPVYPHRNFIVEKKLQQFIAK
jgi:hypothetical protein